SGSASAAAPARSLTNLPTRSAHDARQDHPHLPPERLADGHQAHRDRELVGAGHLLPCARVPQLADWPKAQRPGLYLLFGAPPLSGGDEEVYIGEAENALVRLKQHVANKEFWDAVVVFTSKDENLTKAHVKYLEAEVLRLAKSIKRAKLHNKDSPQPPNLPRADRAAMDEFLGFMRMILATLGYPFLQPLLEGLPEPGGGVGSKADPSAVESVTFHLVREKKHVHATGVVTDEGFVVRKGSTVSKVAKDYMTPGYFKQHADLVQSGLLADRDTHYELTEDHLFASPSAAAAVVVGHNLNGRKDWKDSAGRSLAEVEEASLDPSDGA
ncbi:MAG: GIY-YIG nuclease family protein, partial [Myxococcales bacterium]|nr:GIY-YIG nuclease family protein [Myxococcales bacterium]